LNALLEGATNLPNVTEASAASDSPNASVTAAIVRENLAKDKQAVGDIKGMYSLAFIILSFATLRP